MGVIAGVHRTDHTGQRLTQRSRVKSRAIVRQKTSHLHHIRRDEDVGRVTAGVAIGISRSGQKSGRTVLVVESRLDGELIPRLELILPLGADLYDLAGELVADDRRILSDVVWDSLMVGTLM